MANYFSPSLRVPKREWGRGAELPHIRRNPFVDDQSRCFRQRTKILTIINFLTFQLTFPLLNITSSPQNLIFFSSPKTGCLHQLTADPFLFSSTMSTLIFRPKVAVAHTWVKVLLGLVFPHLNLQNSLLYSLIFQF